jgi:hypothetical protein
LFRYPHACHFAKIKLTHSQNQNGFVFSKKDKILSMRLLSWLICAILVSAPLITSCLFDDKKKDTRRGAGANPELIKRDSIFFDRLGDKTSARLTFTTNIPATCSYSFYSQDQDGRKADTKPCSGDSVPKTNFAERVAPLDPNKLYFLTLTAKDAGNPTVLDSIIVREPPAGGPAGSTPSLPSPGPADPTPGTPPAGGTSALLSELFVARIDMVLRTGELFRHGLKTPTNAESIRKDLQPPLGCFDEAPTSGYPYRSADPNASISQVATRDLASGLAVPKSGQAGLLRLDYAAINDGIDKWTFMYRLQNQDQLYTARPIIRLGKVVVTSDQAFDLDYPNLDESSEPVKIDPLKPLKVQWTVPPQTPASSYVTIQIGRPTLVKSVFCVFQADQRSGTIDPKWIQNLDSGRHVISVELATTIFSPKDKWITTAFDWRSGRVEK